MQDIDFENPVGKHVRVEEYIQHPLFHPKNKKLNYDFDIGILRLEAPVEYRTNFIDFVCFAKSTDTDLIDGSYQSEMTGFGFIMVWIHKLWIMMERHLLERFEFDLPPEYPDQFLELLYQKVFVYDDQDAMRKIAEILDRKNSFDWFDKVKSTGHKDYKVQVSAS